MKKILCLIFLYSVQVNAQVATDCAKLSDAGSFNNAAKCFEVWSNTKPADPENHYLRIKNLNRSATPENIKLAVELGGKMNQTTPFYAMAQVWNMLATSNSAAAKANAEIMMKTYKAPDAGKLVEIAEAFLTIKPIDSEFALRLLNQAETLMKVPTVAFHIQKGNYFRSLGDHGSALNSFNLALDKEPKNFLAHYYKGYSYSLIGSYPTALTEFDEAMKIQEEFPNAMREKAEVLIKLGKLQEGKDAYESYFKIAPQDINARLSYGSALYASKDFAGALVQADNVLQQKSDMIAAYKLKAYSNYELNQIPEGIENINRYLAIADSSVIVSRDYETLGRLYQKTGDDSLALTTLMTAVDKPGAKSELFTEVISTLAKKGKYDDVISVYNKKSALFTPTSADSYNCGRAYLATGDFVSADSLFTKVTELQPTWPNGFLMRGNANANLDPGSTEGKAKPFYEKYVELAEADTMNTVKNKNGLIEAYKYLGYYYYLAKDISQSKIYWKKVILLEPNDKQAQEALKQL
ncbi:MAG TPA: tetratricopeptide repeat protein [Bacteroidia bacterium]|nr:tetratricopeptide repeat protein [Bacteroidia bacterium]